MSKITPTLLTDTLNLIQLARETARAQGNQSQAERLKPLADNLRNLVNESREAKPQAAAGVFAQDDFKFLLAAAQTKPPQNEAVAGTAQTPTMSVAPGERAQIVVAMAAGGMTDIDIARQLGMTRDEVRLVLSVHGAHGSNARSSETNGA